MCDKSNFEIAEQEFLHPLLAIIESSSYVCVLEVVLYMVYCSEVRQFQK